MECVVSSYLYLQKFLYVLRFPLIEKNQWTISNCPVLHLFPFLLVSIPSLLDKLLWILIYNIWLGNRPLDHFCSHSNPFRDLLKSFLIKKKKSVIFHKIKSFGSTKNRSSILCFVLHYSIFHLILYKQWFTIVMGTSLLDESLYLTILMAWIFAFRNIFTWTWK